MRDGVELVADHYRPLTSNPAGTLLVRGPYGRRYPVSVLFGAVYASRGYHVIVQSVRGTFGSGGDFDPFRHEIADGADTAAWLRDQPWFTGTFATIGDVLPRLHPVGVADRSAAGNGGRGHHRRAARYQWTTLGHRLFRAQRLPRMERFGRPPGRPGPGPDHRATRSGQRGWWRARPPGCRSVKRAERCSARVRRGSSPGWSTPSTTTRSGRRFSCTPRWTAPRSRCCCSPAGRTCSSNRRWRSMRGCAGAECPSP